MQAEALWAVTCRPKPWPDSAEAKSRLRAMRILEGAQGQTNEKLMIDFEPIFDTFESANFVGRDALTVYLNRNTGEIAMVSEIGFDEIDPKPEDSDSGKYVILPDKRDLGLGKPLALRFAVHKLPDHLETVERIFTRRGAYSEFKDLLAQEDLLDAWYGFENEEERKALWAWCKDEGVALESTPPS